MWTLQQDIQQNWSENCIKMLRHSLNCLKKLNYNRGEFPTCRKHIFLITDYKNVKRIGEDEQN